ncbi:hypothetical protein Tco_0870533, partial [Tanacetum coccineum]
MKVEESLNVTFDETPSAPKTSPLEDNDLVEEEAIEVSKTRTLGNDLEDKSLENNKIINKKESKSHPLENVIVEESLNVTFDETPPSPKTSLLEDDDLVEEEAIEVNKTKALGNDLEDKSLENNEIINIKESKSHPLDNVIGNLNKKLLDHKLKTK